MASKRGGKNIFKKKLEKARSKALREAGMSEMTDASSIAARKKADKTQAGIAKAREMGKAAAASPKPTRPAKPTKSPSAPKIPAADKMKVKKGATMAAPKMDITPDVAAPRPMGEVKKRRSPGARAGARGRRIVRRMGGGMMKSKMKAKGMSAGGKMKAKGMSAGGKMPMAKDPKTGKMVPEFAVDGKGKMMGGGKVKSKGYKAGGKMKAKGYKAGGKMKAKGGSTGGKKQKVRGAGIARKGVRPAKMY